MSQRLIWRINVKREGKEWEPLGSFRAPTIDEAIRKALKCVRPGELVRVGSCTFDPGRVIGRSN